MTSSQYHDAKSTLHDDNDYPPKNRELAARDTLAAHATETSFAIKLPRMTLEQK
jgi:hypothetical protein